MSIRFIVGKPGAGKGLVAVQWVVDELIHGTRPIIGNLALKVDPWCRADGTPQMGLKAYLMKKVGRDCGVDERVILLSDEQVNRFFLRRDRETECGVVKQKEGVIEVYETESAAGKPAFYVVDEAWKVFGARQWQSTGKGVLFWAAQHRKLGDDCWIVTQHCKQVDVALRQVAQDFTEVKNHGKLRLGWFRRPSVFTTATYETEPGLMSEPMERRTFKLDVEGLAQCYDTSAGVGMRGGAVADVGERRRGLHWAWAVAGLILLLVGIWHVPWLLGKGVRAGVRGSLAPLHEITNQTSSGAATVPGSNHVVVPVKLPMAPAVEERARRWEEKREVEKPAKRVEESEEVFITGLAQFGGRVWITMSDGERYCSTDREVQLVTDRMCVINGVVYRWARQKPEVGTVGKSLGMVGMGSREGVVGRMDQGGVVVEPGPRRRTSRVR